MKSPFVSVIMPSYNTESKYLHEAVESVLNQTYKNFELLIIDDGSSTSVESILSDITDPRIVHIKNVKNMGLPYTLNIGIEQAKGKYIIRMDSDDICVKERFQKEIEFLENHTDIDVVATFAKSFGAQESLYHMSSSDDKIKAELLWKNPIVHPTVAIRSKTLRDKKILYKPGTIAEDYELWSRMMFREHCHCAVIPEVLLMYRIHSGQVTQKKKKQLMDSSSLILEGSLTSLAVLYNSAEMQAYMKMCFGESISTSEIKKTISLMKKILNKKISSVDNHWLRRIYKKELVKYGMKQKKIYALLQALRI